MKQGPSQYTAAYNHNTYGNTYGYVHDLSSVDLADADAQYMGLDMNVMHYEASQGADNIALALQAAVARQTAEPLTQWYRWHLRDPDNQYGPLPQSVQTAAGQLRVSAFTAMHDHCPTADCHYQHMTTLHHDTTALQDSLEQLASSFRASRQEVPAVLARRLSQTRELKAHATEALHESAHLANTVETITTAEHMKPLLDTIREIGEVTRNALEPSHEVELLRAHDPVAWAHQPTEHVPPHTRAKYDELQNVPDTSLLCKLSPLMCHIWQRFDMSPCEKKRAAQLADGCAHRPECHVVTCDLSGQFNIQQSDMQCVDPQTGQPTGHNWRAKPCPGYRQQQFG